MAKQPNILVFMTDHQRADSLNMVQCGQEVTPNLNRLAANGTVFSRAYDTCPLCVPARTALATGVYPTANGVVFNDWQGKTAGPFLPIHRRLKEAGYRVGHVGVDHIRVKPPMREQGLDYFINQEDYERYASAHGVTTGRKDSQLSWVREELEGEYVPKRYSNHRTGQWEEEIELFKDFYFKERALEFLRTKAGGNCDPRPFALFVYLWAPHPPFLVPKPYDNRYDPQTLTLPDKLGVAATGEPPLRRLGVPAQLGFGIGADEWRQSWAAHLGLVSMADDFLGEILQELKRQNLYEDTCICVTSDHGDHMGQHAMYQKMEMYEGAVHVPLVMKLPGHEHEAQAGRIVSEVVSHLDLYPSWCVLAGINADDCDGTSLLSAAQSGHGNPERMVFCQYSGNPGLGTIRRAAITGRYKYVYDGDGEEELYDLHEDPQELFNLAASGTDELSRAVLSQMRDACRRYHRERRDFFLWDRQK